MKNCYLSISGLGHRSPHCVGVSVGPATRMKPLLTLSSGSTPSCGAKIVLGFDTEAPFHASIFALFHFFVRRLFIGGDFSGPRLD